MKTIDIARTLTKFGERQGITARRAGIFLISLLEQNAVPYRINHIPTHLPVARSVLTVDGKRIDSAPTAFVGGRIDSGERLISSLIPTRETIQVSNINFNPRSNALSRPNFYFAPSLAIRKRDVARIARAKSVRGRVSVKKTHFLLSQILVGNIKNPKSIVFSHYDSIGPGAIDNASGTAVCLTLIFSKPELLESTLFVFDPNEELSYDYPTYWGHGYRAFERTYAQLLKRAKRLIVVDCVGNGPPQIISDPRILSLAFPILTLSRYLKKTVTIGGDIDKMMEVYQGDTDLPKLLTERNLEDTVHMLFSLICSR